MHIEVRMNNRNGKESNSKRPDRQVDSGRGAGVALASRGSCAW
jgi:hypothetical protein